MDTPAHTPCPVHLSARASFTCERCGSFGCEACRAEGAPYLCRPCAQRGGVGVLRLETVVGDAWRVLTGHPRVALVMGGAYGLMALVTAPSYRRMFEAQARMEAQIQQASAPGAAPPDVFGPLVDMYASIGWVLLLGMPVGMYLTALLLTWVGEALQGRTPAAGALARAALGRTPALLGTMLVTMLLFFAGFVACILPGLALALMLSLAWPATVVGRAGPFEAVGRSWELVRAHLVPMLLVVLVAGGVLMGVGLVSNIFTVLGKPLGVGGQVAGSIVGQVVMGAASVFPYALVTAAFLRLSAARGVGAGVQ